MAGKIVYFPTKLGKRAVFFQTAPCSNLEEILCRLRKEDDPPFAVRIFLNGGQVSPVKPADGGSPSRLPLTATIPSEADEVVLIQDCSSDWYNWRSRSWRLTA